MANEEKDKIKLSCRRNWDKYIYTMLIFFNNFAYGMTCSTFGPTMVDMKYIFNTSMDRIALYQTFYSIGFLIGSLFGFLYKYMNRQIVMTGIVAAMSVAIVLVPYSPSLVTLYMCAVLIGIGSGAFDNCLYVWLIEMWQHRSASIMQVSEFMFGSGSIVGPLIDKPYIIGEPDNSTQPFAFTTSLPNANLTLTDTALDRRSSLKTPFLINGLIQLITPILLTLMFIVKKYEPYGQTMPDNTVNDNSESTENIGAQEVRLKLIDGLDRPRKLFIALSALLLSSYLTLEFAKFQFSATYYQFIALRLSAPNAAQMVSTMATAFTIGRGVSAFIAIKVKPQHMIAYHFLILLVAFVLLLIGQNSYTILWSANLLIGIGMSALWAAIFAFIEQYISVTNRVSAVFMFFCGLMPMFTPFILGPFIENYPNVYIEFALTYLILCVIIFIAMLFIIRKYR